MLTAWLVSKPVIDTALWIGTACIVGAYAYNSWFLPTKRRQHLIYQAVNLIGTVLYLYGMSILQIYQSLALNAIWGTIGIIAICKLMKKRQG